MVVLSSLLATFPAIFWLKQFLWGRSRNGESPTEPLGTDRVSNKRIRPNHCGDRCSLSDRGGRRYRPCSCKLMLYQRRQMKSSPDCRRKEEVGDAAGGHGAVGRAGSGRTGRGKAGGQALPKTPHTKASLRPTPQQQPLQQQQQQQQQLRLRAPSPHLPAQSSQHAHALGASGSSNTSNIRYKFRPSPDSIPTNAAFRRTGKDSESAKTTASQRLPESSVSLSRESLNPKHCSYKDTFTRMACGPTLSTGHQEDGFSFGFAGTEGSLTRESGEEGERTGLRGNGAIFEDGLVLEEIPTAPGNIRSDIWNGQSIRSCTLHECMSRRTFYREGDQLPPELAYLQIPAEEYACAVDHIQSCSKVKYYSLCYNKWLHSCAFSLLFLAIWTLGFLLWSFDLVSVKMGTGVFFLVAVACVLFGVFLCHCVQNKFDSTSTKMIAKANEIFTKYHVIVGLLEEGMLTCYRISIHFIYFDLAPCLETLAEELGKHMKRKMHKKPKQRTLERIPSVSDTDLIIPSLDITDSQRHALAQDLLLLYCNKYVDNLVTGRMRMPKTFRHAQDVQCLCQFIHGQFFYRSGSTLGASEEMA